VLRRTLENDTLDFFNERQPLTSTRSVMPSVSRLNAIRMEKLGDEKGVGACGGCFLRRSPTGTTSVKLPIRRSVTSRFTRSRTSALSCCMDDDMVIKGPTGQSFFLRITHPSPRAAVIWLEEKKLREKWCRLVLCRHLRGLCNANHP
jgi:hypothetical protein